MQCGQSINLTVLTVQVAELYEDLKKRVSQFNMNVADTQSFDYTSTHRQKFILQVFANHWKMSIHDFPSSQMLCCVHLRYVLKNIILLWIILCVQGGHCWCVLPQLLCPGGYGWRFGVQRAVWLQPENNCDGISCSVVRNTTWDY